MNARGEAIARLDAEGIDNICDRIVGGQTYTEIAEDLGVSIGAFIAWIASEGERSVRAREARIQAAQSWDDKAEKIIADAKSQLELQKARELAQHLRWRASKIAPRDYGDKLQVESNVNIVNLSEEEIARRRAAIQEKLNGEQAPPAIEAPRE